MHVRHAISAPFLGLIKGLTVAELRKPLLKVLFINAIGLGCTLGLFAMALSGLVVATHWLIAITLGIALFVFFCFFVPTLYALIATVFLPVLGDSVFRAGRNYAGGDNTLLSDLSVRSTLSTAMKRLGRYVVFSVGFASLNLIPGVGSAVYAVLQSLLTARTLGWDLVGYHMESHNMDYPAQKAFVTQHRWAVIALGFSGMLLLLIPFLNLLCITTNVAGAGILSAKIDQHNTSTAQ